MKALLLFCTAAMVSASPYLSPQALVASQSGGLVYVALAGSHQIAVFDTARGLVVRKIELHAEPTGLALSRDDSQLFVTSTQAGEDVLQVISLPDGGVVSRPLKAHGARSPVLTPDGKSLYLCSRFDNSVLVLDPATFRERARIPVSREPYAAAMTAGGASLLVACHLPDEPATAAHISSKVCVIEPAHAKLAACISLVNGSTGARGIAVSPDGRYAYVTHTLARYTLPTSQIEQGWINNNAVSIIDIRARKMLNSILLDEVNDGAANPWAIACTGDGKQLWVTHAGTHEVSMIDLPGLMTRLRLLPPDALDDVPNDLGFLSSLRTRIKLEGQGPRAIAPAGSRMYVAEYFTDTLQRISLDKDLTPSVKTFPLGPAVAPTVERRGEILFHDGRICLQHWQSCSSCHPDGRTDGLNWDLLNDGLGNPKNVKSLVLAHRSSPVMWTGVRPDAAYAVRTGMKYILFAEPAESLAAPIFAYIQSLTPLPSPSLAGGKFTAAAERGRSIFIQAGCALCHAPPLYTDGKAHDVRSSRGVDSQSSFVTPTLVEVWRTAPYFHDGRYATIRDAIAGGNCNGRASRLTAAQLQDLVEFVLSL